MKIEIVSFETKDSWHVDIVEEMIRKSAFFAEVSHSRLSRKKSRKGQQKKMDESNLFLSHIADRDFLIACDEHGRSLTSQTLASQMEKWMLSSSKLVFAIGGAYGWSAEVLERADFKMSLSSMTMNHLVAEVVLVEQVYRALTILNNHPYHNA